jgi:hypothetical protein
MKHILTFDPDTLKLLESQRFFMTASTELGGDSKSSKESETVRRDSVTN